jgi:hypothetical protein
VGADGESDETNQTRNVHHEVHPPPRIGTRSTSAGNTSNIGSRLVALGGSIGIGSSHTSSTAMGLGGSTSMHIRRQSPRLVLVTTTVTAAHIEGVDTISNPHGQTRVVNPTTNLRPATRKNAISKVTTTNQPSTSGRRRITRGQKRKRQRYQGRRMPFRGEDDDSRPRLNESSTLDVEGSRPTKKIVTRDNTLRLRSSSPQRDDKLTISDSEHESHDEAPNDPTYR